MKLIKVFSFVITLVLTSVSFSSPQVLNFQAQITKPDGSKLDSSAVSFRFKYLNSSGTCTVYIEDFPNISMAGSGGNISIKMGTGVRAFPTVGPTTLFDTFSNRLSNAMDCWEHPGVSPYAPLESLENRRLKVEFVYSGSGGIQTLNGIEINSVPYAMYSSESDDSERLGGVAANMFTKFSDFATCTSGKFLLWDGSAFVCDYPNNFTGSFSGDVTGTQSLTVVSQVGGKTAAQVSTSVNDTLSATSSATASTIVKRDSSGNSSFVTAQATNFSGRNLLLFESTNANSVTLKAPATFSAGDYILTLPQNKGMSGYVLSTDGNGVTSWIPAANGSITNVTASSPLSSSGGLTPNITMQQADATHDGYLSQTDFVTFNNKISSQWVTSGSDIYYNIGKVGIGTNTLTSTLTVKSSFANTGNNIFEFYNSAGVQRTSLTDRGAQTWNVQTNSGVEAGSIAYGTPNAVPGIVFRDAAGNSRSDITLLAGGGFVFAPGTTSAKPNESIRISATGNLGVANNNPNYKVDVAGDVNVSGNFKINGVNISNTNGTVTNVQGASPISVSNGTTTPLVSIDQADSTRSGYLSSTDWNMFNDKVSSQWEPVGAGINYSGGFVGISTSDPRSHLDINGTVLHKEPLNNKADTKIDFMNGNIQYSEEPCQHFQLNRMANGGSYMFVIQNTHQGLCEFEAFDLKDNPLEVHMPPDHDVTIDGKETIYNFVVVNGKVYVSWTPGY